MGGGVALASVPSSTTGALTACVLNTSGAVRLIDYQADKRCSTTEHTVSWSKGYRYRGAWSSAAAYSVLDVVTYLGSSYLAFAPSANRVPTTTGYWGLLAARGATGAPGTAATRFAAPGTSTYTPPAGVHQLEIQVWGGGGGGGGGDGAQNHAGGGGAQGSYTHAIVPAAASCSVTVGSGGTGGLGGAVNAPGSNGSDGVSSTVTCDTATVTAHGGGGGFGGDSSPSTGGFDGHGGFGAASAQFADQQEFSGRAGGQGQAPGVGVGGGAGFQATGGNGGIGRSAVGVPGVSGAPGTSGLILIVPLTGS